MCEQRDFSRLKTLKFLIFNLYIFENYLISVVMVWYNMNVSNN